MLPAIYNMVQKLPSVRSEFNALKEYYNKYHSYDMPDEETIQATYSTYTVIDPVDVKQKITDYLGKVLARCWIEPTLLDEIEQDCHAALLSMGVILPRELVVRVRKRRKVDRPALIVYEIDQNGKEHRVCFLQLSMLAGR